MAQYKGIGYDSTGKVRTGTNADTVQFNGGIDVIGNASVGGNLNVVGDIISGGSENVVISDPAIDLGVGATTAQTTGFSFVAKAGTNSNTITSITASTRVVVCSAATSIAANDIVQISGSSDASNNGLYVVASVASPNITLGNTAYVGTAPFIQTALNGDSTGGTISQVNLKALVVAGNNLINDGGASPYPEGTLLEAFSADAVISDFTTDGSYVVVGSGTTTLQDAYDSGNTITLTNGNNLAVSKATSGTASITLEANANSSFSTVTTGDLTFSSAAALSSTATTTNTISASSASAGAVVLNATNAASSVEIKVNSSPIIEANSAGASITGTLDASGLASLDGGIDVDGAFTVADTSGNVSTTGTLNVDSTSTFGDNITLDKATGSAQGISKTSSAGGDDFIISMLGANDASLLLDSEGTGADAIGISASAGDIAMEAEASGKSITITASLPHFATRMSTETSIADKDALYITQVGGVVRVAKADATQASTAKFSLVALNAASGSGGSPANLNTAMNGIVNMTNATTWSTASHAGVPVYLSKTAGQITHDISGFTTAGNVIFQVGIAINGSGNDWQILLQPQFIMEIG